MLGSCFGSGTLLPQEEEELLELDLELDLELELELELEIELEVEREVELEVELQLEFRQIVSILSFATVRNFLTREGIVSANFIWGRGWDWD